MDKQLLQALDNLSVALEKISETLNKKDSKSSTGKAMESGNFGGQLKEINNGIKKLLADNQKILKNQQTILASGKKKETDKKTGVLEDVGGDKKKESSIKKGVGTILLIAVAVLAIGLAFKLVGNIDFMSVIGLALAITLVSIAFEKIAKLDISLKKAFTTSIVLVLIAAAITISSWIMSLIMPISFAQGLTAVFISLVFMFISQNLTEVFVAVVIFSRLKVSPFNLVKVLVAIAAAITASSWVMSLIMPISFAQGLTAIFISLTFAIISYNLHKIALGVVLFKRTGVKPFDLIKTLVAISAAIVASSWILQFVIPMSFGQLITAVFISVIFMLISFNLHKIAIGVILFKKTGVKPADLLWTFIGISAAITASSWILSLVMPIGFTQAITAILIALMFALISYVMPELAIGLAIMKKFVGESSFYLIPLLYVAIAAAITISSWILAMTKPIPFMTLVSILAISIVMAIATLVLGLAMIILAKVGNVGDFIKGGIAVVIIAATIMISSIILSLGTYEKYPEWEWALGVGLSLAVFGIAAVLLGTQALNPFFYAGLGVTLLVAGTIVAASAIFALGSYADGSYPSLSWALGVGGSIAAFGVAAVLLGFQVFNPFFYMGLGVILVVAATIVATSLIFAQGKFDVGKFPSVEWMLGATGVILTMSLVAVGIAFLSPLIILGSIAIMITALTIMLVDKVFSEGKFKLYPSDKWMKGATKSILEIAMIAVGMAFLLPLIILGSISMMVTALTIMLIDKVFSQGKFKLFPSDKWMKGTTKSILEIAMIAVGMAFLLPLIILGSISMMVTALTILLIDKVFSEGKFKLFPSDKWMKGTTKSILEIAMISVDLAFLLPLIIFGAFSVLIAAWSIKKVDDIFRSGEFKSYPSKQWIDGVSETIIKWTGLMDSISFGSVAGGAIADFFGGGLTDVAQSIVSVDTIIKTGDFKTYPSKQWVDGVGASLMSMSMIMSSDLEVNEDVLGVADIMVLMASKIKANIAVFNSSINPGFMKSIASNVTSYVELAKYVAGNYPGQKGGLVGAVQGMIFGAESTGDPMDRVVSGMIKLGNAYAKLSQSIKNFGNSINAIDAEKLSAIKSFTSNVILMSLMDADMFEDMLDRLEDKAGVFVEAINEIDAEKEDPKNPKGKGVNASKATKAAPDPNQQRMIQLLSAMDAKLGTIAKNSGTLADYTNELRTSSSVKVKK